MEKNQVYYVEVDSEGDLVENGFVLIEGNYISAINNKNKAIEGKIFKKIENNPPEINENQVRNYLGWSQKTEKEGKPVSTNWEVTTLSNEDCLNMWVRGPRQMLLNDSDWTQTNDAPLSAESKIEWANYRTELRDITSLFNDQNPLVSFSQIFWPSKPGTFFVEPSVEDQ